MLSILFQGEWWAVHSNFQYLHEVIKQPVPPQWNLFRTLAQHPPGNAGLIHRSSIYTILTPEVCMQALPTGLNGHFPESPVGLLLGRSSTTAQGIFVAPGVIDTDSEGEIGLWITHQRLVQLIFLPQVQARNNQVKEGERGKAGFGSSDAYWLQAIIHSNQNSLC